MVDVWFAATPLLLCPVQANLVVQENRYVVAMQDLQKAQAELDDKQAELDVVQAEYEQAMTEKQVTVPWCGRDRHTPRCGNCSSFLAFSRQRFGLDQGFIGFIQMQTQHIIPH